MDEWMAWPLTERGIVEGFVGIAADAAKLLFQQRTTFDRLLNTEDLEPKLRAWGLRVWCDREAVIRCLRVMDTPTRDASG